MTLLKVDKVRKEFGSLVAVAEASLTIGRNEIVGLIGPNGSGKSTLLHTICGRTLATSGTVRLLDRDVTRLRPNQRARAGMAIKFQLARIYLNKTVAENLLLALQAELPLSRLLLGRSRRDFEKRMSTLLDDFGLTAKADAPAASLSHGEQQWLEISMAMAREPKLLLLDEPTAGMSPRERHDTGELIRAAARTCGVLIVEHDLAFIRNLCDRITVLHQGTVIATGTPAQIETDPRVQEVYLTRV